MSERELLALVPTRGRPHNIPRILKAWEDTGAYVDAQLCLIVDADDPEIERYRVFASDDCFVMELAEWMPLVPKLNQAAKIYGAGFLYPYIAFMGDDHVPRTRGWARTYIAELKRLGTGVVYGDDLVQGQKLCTQFAMTSDIVRTLGGRMIPADVEHMYMDNSVMALAEGAGCLKYLPDVKIEHAHPVAGRGAWDEGYAKVNSREQFRQDWRRYRQWLDDRAEKDVQAVKDLIFKNKIKTIGTVSKLTKDQIIDGRRPDGERCKTTVDQLGNKVTESAERQDVEIKAPVLRAAVSIKEERQ